MVEGLAIHLEAWLASVCAHICWDGVDGTPGFQRLTLRAELRCVGSGRVVVCRQRAVFLFSFFGKRMHLANGRAGSMARKDRSRPTPQSTVDPAVGMPAPRAKIRRQSPNVGQIVDDSLPHQAPQPAYVETTSLDTSKIGSP